MTVTASRGWGVVRRGWYIVSYQKIEYTLYLLKDGDSKINLKMVRYIH